MNGEICPSCVWLDGISLTPNFAATSASQGVWSTELRKWFGHDLRKWADFQRRYQAEIEEQEVALEPVLQAARHGTVTLLYSSHDTEHNNAVVLRDYLERKLEPGRKSKRAQSGA